MYEQHLTELIELTKKLHRKAVAIDTNMENNEDGQLEKILALLEKRQETIECLSVFITEDRFNWTDSDRNKILEQKKLEDLLQPLITGLYKEFGEQLNRINQSKQMSKKYLGAYQNIGAGGSFIDKRK